MAHRPQWTVFVTLALTLACSPAPTDAEARPATGGAPPQQPAEVILADSGLSGEAATPELTDRELKLLLDALEQEIGGR